MTEYDSGIKDIMVAAFKWTSHHQNLLLHTPDTRPRDCGCECSWCRWFTNRDLGAKGEE